MKTSRSRKTTSATRATPQPEPQRSPAVETAASQSEITLLAVTGMSPAILTETLWALANPAADSDPVIPHRIIAVTTTEGRARLETLFQPSAQLGGLAPWDALRIALEQRGHDLSGRLRFGVTGDDIRVITAADPASGRTRELPDIRDRADNEAAADFLLEQVRALVENPDTQLIASIAGGRKTMSALLYACLTLVGRETDRLTHVLVSEPFETLRDFWFPAQPGGPLEAPTRSSESVPSAGSVRSVPTHDPAHALVELADVPFVPLRNLFERELARKPGTFRRLVEDCRQNLIQRAAEQLRLILDPVRSTLEINGFTLNLAPAEMLLTLFLARRARHGEPPYLAYKDTLEDLNHFRAEQIEQASTHDWNDWRTADSLRADWDERNIVKTLSDLRAKLKHAGPDAALLAQCLPRKGCFALSVVPSLIHIK
jgi:CRISPR-associated protein (TIGR02584 family)